MSRPDWPLALPDWAERGDTVVGRLLRTLKARGSDFPDDVQTRRLLVAIDDIRRRRRPRYHRKMRAVDVADLERLERFWHSAQADNTTVAHVPLSPTRQERAVRGEAALRRGLRALGELVFLCAEYAAFWVDPHSWCTKQP